MATNIYSEIEAAKFTDTGFVLRAADPATPVTIFLAPNPDELACPPSSTSNFWREPGSSIGAWCQAVLRQFSRARCMGGVQWA